MWTSAWLFSFPSVYLHPLIYLCTTVITHLDFHLARLHISSSSWLLLYCRYNISLIFCVCFNVNIFSLECGHPEVYTEFKRGGWVYLESYICLFLKKCGWQEPLKIHCGAPLASPYHACKLFMWSTVTFLYVFSSVISNWWITRL